MILSFAKFINVVRAEISSLLPHRSKMVSKLPSEEFYSQTLSLSADKQLKTSSCWYLKFNDQKLLPKLDKLSLIEEDCRRLFHSKSSKYL